MRPRIRLTAARRVVRVGAGRRGAPSFDRFGVGSVGCSPTLSLIRPCRRIIVSLPSRPRARHCAHRAAQTAHDDLDSTIARGRVRVVGAREPRVRAAVRLGRRDVPPPVHLWPRAATRARASARVPLLRARHPGRVVLQVGPAGAVRRPRRAARGARTGAVVVVVRRRGPIAARGGDSQRDGWSGGRRRSTVETRGLPGLTAVASTAERSVSTARRTNRDPSADVPGCAGT